MLAGNSDDCTRTQAVGVHRETRSRGLIKGGLYPKGKPASEKRRQQQYALYADTAEIAKNTMSRQGVSLPIRWSLARVMMNPQSELPTLRIFICRKRQLLYREYCKKIRLPNCNLKRYSCFRII